MSGELMLLTKTTNDNKWLQDNIDEVRKEHENKFVAVENEHILASSEDFQELAESLKKEGKTVSTVLVRFIHKKGEAIIF